jgi:Methyltransferase domain
MMKAALRGTQIRHYHGIDLSQAALELAASNLAEMPFEVDLDHRDFVEAMMRRPEHADAAWCSLSVHHLATDDKTAPHERGTRRYRRPRDLSALRADSAGR